MAKKKSKLKSALKKIGKAAAVAGAGYLAMKGLKGREETAADANDGFRTRSKFNKPSIGMVTDGSNQKMPGNLSRSAGATGPAKFKYPKIAYGQQVMAKGGRASKKTKPKSIGKALRGGGKVMR